jgi:hypothetical protein
MNKKRFVINIIAIAILIGAVAYMLILNSQRRESLAGEINYTIGEIKEYKIGPKSRMFIYNFEIDLNKIEGHFSIDEKFRKKYDFKMKPFIGKKFLVKYSVDKPKFNEMYINKPIPDSLLNCKFCIWSKPPF